MELMEIGQQTGQPTVVVFRLEDSRLGGRLRSLLGVLAERNVLPSGCHIFCSEGSVRELILAIPGDPEYGALDTVEHAVRELLPNLRRSAKPLSSDVWQRHVNTARSVPELR